MEHVNQEDNVHIAYTSREMEPVIDIQKQLVRIEAVEEFAGVSDQFTINLNAVQERR